MQVENSTGQSGETCQSEQDGVVRCVKDGADLTRKGVVLRLVIFAILLAGAVKPIWWAPGGDASCYVAIARSLGQDGKLERLGQSFLYYPPGVSFMYAPAFWFGDRPFLLMSMIQWLAAVIAMGCIFAWFRRWLSRDHAVILTALVFFNVCSWGYYVRFLSETLFCCLLFGLAVIFQYLLDAVRAQRVKQAIGLACLSVPILVWLILTRPVGVFAAGGLGLAMFVTCVKSHKRSVWLTGMTIAVLLNVLAATIALSWLSYNKHQAQHYGESTYVNQLVDVDQSMVGSVLDNVHRRVNTVGRLLVPGLFRTYADLGDWLNPLMVLYVGLSVLVVWGFVKLMRLRVDAFVWMIPLYVGMYMIWPYGQGTRFFIPILPVVLLAGYQLIAKRKWCDTFLLVFLVLHMVFLVGRYAKEWPEALALHRQWSQIDTIADEMKQAGQPDMVWASMGLDTDQLGMLSFTTNHTIVMLERDDKTTTPDGVVMIEGSKLPFAHDAYRQVAQTGPYVILRRE